MRKYIIIISLVVLIIIGVYCFNYFQLQSKMDNLIKADPRNNGIKVSVHFGSYVIPSIVIYNLKSISNTNSMADVFRVFLQFAEKTKSKRFNVIKLSFRGKLKFKLNGDYFQLLGIEYSSQNPIYTMRTFPENLLNPDGTNTYPKWTGGLFGVFKEQMENFNDFHKKWYLEDITK